MRMTAFAPCSIAYLIVGIAPTIRWGFVTLLSLSRGTLKSTRMSTRLSLRSTLSMDSLLLNDILATH